MKRIFGIALVLAVVTTLCFGSVALAGDPTKVDVDWDGTGDVGVTLDAEGDAEIAFSTWGYGISGEFHAVDWNDNPGGIDMVRSWADASVGNGGEISFDVLGESGQESYSFVGTSGTADMTFSTTTYSGGLTNWEYRGGNFGQLSASGPGYEILHWIQDVDGDGAGVDVLGQGGSATVTTKVDWIGSDGSFEFGAGYREAGVKATGLGETTLSGGGSDRLSGWNWSMPNGGSYKAIWSYVNGVDVGYQEFLIRGN